MNPISRRTFFFTVLLTGSILSSPLGTPAPSPVFAPVMRELHNNQQCMALLGGVLCTVPAAVLQRDFAQNAVAKGGFTVLFAAQAMQAFQEEGVRGVFETARFFAPALATLHCGNKAVYKKIKVWHVATALSVLQCGHALY